MQAILQSIFNVVLIFMLLYFVAFVAKIPTTYRHLFFSFVGDVIIMLLIWQDSWAVIKDRSVLTQQWSNSLPFQIITATVLYDQLITRPQDNFSKVHHAIVLLGMFPVYALHSKLMNFILFSACGPFGIGLWTLMGLGIFKKITKKTQWTGILFIHAFWRYPMVLLALYEGFRLVFENQIHFLFLLPITALFLSIQMVTYYEAKGYFKYAQSKDQ